MNFEQEFDSFLTALPRAVFYKPARLPTFKAPTILLEPQTIFGLQHYNWQHPNPSAEINRLYNWIHNPEIPELPERLSKWILNSSTYQDPIGLKFRYFLWLIVDVKGSVNFLDKNQGLIINNEQLLLRMNTAMLGWSHNQWGLWTEQALKKPKPKNLISPIKSLKTFRDHPIKLRDQWVYDLYSYCTGAFPYVCGQQTNKQNFISMLETARVLYAGSKTSFRFWRQ